MKMLIVLNQDEIQKQIPYAVVAETMSSSIWNTGRRKRLMAKYFTEAEMEEAEGLHRLARCWYLYKNAPKEARMTMDTYYLWQRLAQFCWGLSYGLL